MISYSFIKPQIKETKNALADILEAMVKVEKNKEPREHVSQLLHFHLPNIIIALNFFANLSLNDEIKKQISVLSCQLESIKIYVREDFSKHQKNDWIKILSHHHISPLPR